MFTPFLYSVAERVSDGLPLKVVFMPPGMKYDARHAFPLPPYSAVMWTDDEVEGIRVSRIFRQIVEEATPEQRIGILTACCCATGATLMADVPCLKDVIEWPDPVVQKDGSLKGGNGVLQELYEDAAATISRRRIQIDRERSLLFNIPHYIALNMFDVVERGESLMPHLMPSSFNAPCVIGYTSMFANQKCHPINDSVSIRGRSESAAVAMAASHWATAYGARVDHVFDVLQASEFAGKVQAINYHFGIRRSIEDSENARLFIVPQWHRDLAEIKESEEFFWLKLEDGIILLSKNAADIMTALNVAGTGVRTLVTDKMHRIMSMIRDRVHEKITVTTTSELAKRRVQKCEVLIEDEVTLMRPFYARNYNTITSKQYEVRIWASSDILREIIRSALGETDQ